MRKLVLMCGILASVASVGMGAMSDDEWQRARHNCFENRDKNACQALIDNGGLPSVEQCYIEKGKGNCFFVGGFYLFAERYREAIPYYEKSIASGDNMGYSLLAMAYYELQDYYNVKKYSEIACDKGNGDILQSESCFKLGMMYDEGKGVRQDYYKAHELYKKACDMKYGAACNNLGSLYDRGQGVRQNRSTAKGYYGKACNFGDQLGCDNYKAYNERGW